MTDELRAPCGVVCSILKCDVFKATQTDDDELRAKCLEKWREGAKEHWGIELKLDDINCKGCIQSDEAIFAPKYCPIPKCAKKKGYTSCSQCADWQTCGWLLNLFKDVPEAKEYLASQS